MSAVFRIVLLGMVLLLCTAPPASAQKEDDPFEEGLEAIEEEEWEDAIDLFTEAIDINKKESTRRIGQNILRRGGTEYTPYAYLGEAQFQSGDCAAALGSWDESERQGIMPTLKTLLSRVERGRVSCEQRGFLLRERLESEGARVAGLVAAAEAVVKEMNAARAAHPEMLTADLRSQLDRTVSAAAQARKKLETGRRSRRQQDLAEAGTTAEMVRADATSLQALLSRPADRTVQTSSRAKEIAGILDEAERINRDITGILSTPAMTTNAPAAVLDSRRRVAEGLTRARERFDAAGRSRSENEMAEAAKLASDVRTEARALLADLETQQQSVTQQQLRRSQVAAAASFASIDARIADVRTRMGQLPADGQTRVTAALTPIEGTLTRLRKRQQQGIASAQLADIRAVQVEVDRLHGPIDALAPLLGATVLVVPDALKQAVQSYFEGRHQTVLTSVPDADLAGLVPSLRLHAHLFRAASLFALFEYSNRKDQALGQSARREVEAVRALNPSFTPDPAVFGPKFLTFFAAGAASR